MKPRSEKEIQSVLRLNGAERFGHFIKRVVDFEEAWGLWSDGWALMEDNSGRPVFPLWPAREYAELCRLGDWAQYDPKAISLSELLKGFLDGLVEREVLAGVFPTPGGVGVTLPAAELATLLRTAELQSYG